MAEEPEQPITAAMAYILSWARNWDTTDGMMDIHDLKALGFDVKIQHRRRYYGQISTGTPVSAGVHLGFIGWRPIFRAYAYRRDDWEWLSGEMSHSAARKAYGLKAGEPVPYMHGGETTATLTHSDIPGSGQGKATCSPSDQFSRPFGRKLAIERALKNWDSGAFVILTTDVEA